MRVRVPSTNAGQRPYRERMTAAAVGSVRRRRFFSERSPIQRSGRQGASLIEVLLVISLLAIVIAAVYGVLLSQRRYQVAVDRLVTALDAERVAIAVLSTELRNASPSAGDLYAIAEDSVALRSSTGFGYVCAVEGNTVTVRRIFGTFGASHRDSLLVLVEGTERGADWAAAGVGGVGGGGRGLCPDGRPADLAAHTHRLPDGVEPGAPVRGFRPYVYRLYRSGSGSWWLGQRPRGGRIQPLAGPFSGPNLDGLTFGFQDSTGRSVDEPGRVVQVSIDVRADRRSAGLARRGSVGVSSGLSAHVVLRNALLAGDRDR